MFFSFLNIDATNMIVTFLDIDSTIIFITNFINDNKIIIIIMLAIIILSTLLVNIKGKNQKKEKAYERKQNDPLLKETNNDKINKEEISKIAYNLLCELKQAKSNLDINKIRSIATDNIYNLYKTQIETLENKNLKNIVEKIKLCKAYITNNDNNNQIVNLRLTIECFDFIITKNNKVVKGQYNQKKLQTYEIEIIKNDDNYLIQKLELLYERDI